MAWYHVVCGWPGESVAGAAAWEGMVAAACSIVSANGARVRSFALLATGDTVAAVANGRSRRLVRRLQGYMRREQFAMGVTSCRAHAEVRGAACPRRTAHDRVRLVASSRTQTRVFDSPHGACHRSIVLHTDPAAIVQATLANARRNAGACFNCWQVSSL